MARNEGTPLLGDRAARNVIDFPNLHATDINDGALLRHLPAPTTANDFIQSDGTNWVTVTAPTFEGAVTIDVTSTEALLVRVNADGGDVFIVDTTTPKVIIDANLEFTGAQSITNSAGDLTIASVGDTIINPTSTDTIVTGGLAVNKATECQGVFEVEGTLGSTYFTPDGITWVITRAGSNYISAVNGNLILKAGGNNIVQCHANYFLFYKNLRLEDKYITNNSSTLGIAIDDAGDVAIGVAAFNGQLSVDQSSATGAQPVLFLDQGDVSEQLILGSYSGADVDMIIIELDVTGAPKLGWSETPDVFTLNKGLAIGDGGTTNYTNISGTGDINFVGSAGLAYASMYTNADIALAIGTATWVEVDAAQAWTTGKVHNCSFADPEITVTNAGTYLIVYDMSILCSLNNKHIETGIMIDSDNTDGPAHGAAGVQDEGRTHAEFAGNTVEISVSGRAVIQLAAGKTISLAVRNEDAGDPTITVGHGNLVVTQIAGGSA